MIHAGRKRRPNGPGTWGGGAAPCFFFCSSFYFLFFSSSPIYASNAWVGVDGFVSPVGLIYLLLRSNPSRQHTQVLYHWGFRRGSYIISSNSGVPRFSHKHFPNKLRRFLPVMSILLSLLISKQSFSVLSFIESSDFLLSPHWTTFYTPSLTYLFRNSSTLHSFNIP